MTKSTAAIIRSTKRAGTGLLLVPSFFISASGRVGSTAGLLGCDVVSAVDIAGAAAVIFAETLVICSGAVGKAEKRFAILLIIIGVLVICKVKFQWYE